jgi:hypothetical protein
VRILQILLPATQSCACGAGALALRGERRLVAGLVDAELLLLGDLADDLHRQAVGVLEPEDDLAREHREARPLRLLDLLLLERRARGDGGEELLLLGAHGGLGGGAGGGELRVGTGHRLVDHRQQAVQERLVDAEAHAVAHARRSMRRST